LRNNISAHPRDLLRSRWCALVFSLALVSLSAPSGFAQSGEAKSGPLHDFVGTYKEQSSEKRVRVIEKDGRLIYESADGLTVALSHLVQSESGDAFRIEESTLTTRDQVKFTRDGAGNVAGLRFAGGTYVRLAARNDALSPSGRN
jgi:hypothetical protein